MADTVKTAFSGNEADLVRALVKIGKNQDRIYEKEVRLAKASRAHGVQAQKTNSTLAKAGRVAKGMAMALGVGVGVDAGLRSIVGLSQRWVGYMDKVADKAVEAGNAMVPIALLQDKGVAAGLVKQSAAMGAKYGRGLQESWDTTQSMQSVFGSPEKGMEVAEIAFKAAQGGVDLKDVTEAILLGNSQGIEAWKAVALPYVAGEKSGRTPRDIIPAAESLGQYTDVNVGWAAASILSGAGGVERLRIAVQNAGVGLNDPSRNDYWKKLGVAEGGNEIAKLRALKSAGIDTAPELASAGFTEIRQRDAIKKLVQNLGDLERFAREIPAEATPTYIFEKRQQRQAELAAAGLPQVKRAEEIASLEARHEAQDALGADAGPAMARKARNLEQGLYLKEHGVGWMMSGNDANGPTSNAAYWALKSSEGVLAESDFGAAMGGGGSFALPIVEALDRNTEAQKETHRALERVGATALR